MSTQETESALDAIVRENKISWGEDRIRNLGATVESLMQRRGFSPRDLVAEDVVEELTQDDLELAA